MNFKKIRKIIKYCIIAFFGSSILSVIVLRFVPVYVTPLMLIRCIQQAADGKEIRLEHHWVPKEKISKHLPMAVIASEDNRFAEHWGFDFTEIKKAAKENKKRKKARGASTISQQTAKNVFLWPQSSWVRKGFEAYFTVLIECFWSKERIMEVYLNSIEMGDGIYGAEAVAEEHFGTTAKELTRGQCALIAASLPNPLRFNSGDPSPYMYKRQKKILYLMKCIPTFPPQER
ncbi:monofunctional biosynthetic peptidoglycan transglycosylase [uncultured Bacteroides sp.]|uniref:monofunctional biosynthetic peptidoglycan transglycosylase n=1 Tax=uncultured Bacteroides sp. TaxID=162156 RepID=UPI0026274619|nr:monofunctional biosynthetic peptidoglycan transglycosylase [uncultured Bacteroides sp.]